MTYGWGVPTTTERSRPADLPEISALLSDAGLPLDGVSEAFTTGVVVRDDGNVLGAAAVEPSTDGGLLRSVVVAPERSGDGIGRALVFAAEELAHSHGLGELLLLTETAAGYFAGLGFTPIPRDEVPASVAASVEFAVACSGSAVAMRRIITPR